MTTCNINKNRSDILFQVISINKAILKLNIEQLEDEILCFEDALYDALNHPEKNNSNYLKSIKEKFNKLRLLKEKLADLDK
ncbi:MAG: hypothetical protein II961_08925 [Candidatus Riflebacteria bacterium]|nr:hypothetical protein [Candidatus Riflebacteria bacterium]